MHNTDYINPIQCSAQLRGSLDSYNRAICLAFLNNFFNIFG